jgi:molybdate transport system ATP-binding protein
VRGISKTNELRVRVALDRGPFHLRIDESVALDGITALFGPSGAGKTTLLRVLAGLEPDVEGDIVFDGAVWHAGRKRTPAHRRGIGYVFQDGRLFTHLSVAENLRFAERRAQRPWRIGGRGGEGAGRDAASQPARRIDFASTVAALDLAPLLERKPQSLSGGERQRVAIGRALLTSPRLVLMDEPLSSLDRPRKREIVPHIEALPERFGVPVLYVTHDVDEVARLASNVLLIEDGRITARGGVTEVLERIDLAPLSDTGAVLTVRVAESRDGITALALGAERLKVPMKVEAREGASLRVRIRAQDVAIATQRPVGLSIRNALPARILEIVRDDDAHVELLLEVEGQHLRSRITRDALEDLRLEKGANVFALLKSVALESSVLS